MRHRYKGLQRYSLPFKVLGTGIGAGIVTLDSLSSIISQLFGSGEQGGIYIPSPIVNGVQSLFQNSAGTVPVTADGDPVGRMIDLSGNGNHATQSVSGNRPVYRTDGVLHWLKNEEGGHGLLYPESTISTSHTMAFAISPDTVAGRLQHLLSTDAPGANLDVSHLATTAGKIGIFDNVSWKQPGDATLGKQVLIYDLNGLQSDFGLYRNDNLIGSRLAYNPQAVSAPAGLFRATTARNEFEGNIYGVVILHNTISTSGRGDLNSYLEVLGGIT